MYLLAVYTLDLSLSCMLDCHKTFSILSSCTRSLHLLGSSALHSYLCILLLVLPWMCDNHTWPRGLDQGRGVKNRKNKRHFTFKLAEIAATDFFHFSPGWLPPVSMYAITSDPHLFIHTSSGLLWPPNDLIWKNVFEDRVNRVLTIDASQF